MTETINIGTYNKFSGIDEIPYNCIEYLILNNEPIWKLLKYTSADAWSKSNVSKVDKGAMVYGGQEDATKFNVFMDVGIPDVWTHEVSVLRASLYELYPDNRNVGTIGILFEFYAHYKINHLSNYKTRIDMATQQIIETMNGAIVGGIGKLHFNRMGFQNDRAYAGGQVPYKGRFILMSNKIA